MRNQQRDEMAVRIASRVWKMRPDFDTIARIEDETGLGVAAIVQRFATSAFGVREVAAIVSAGVRAVHGDEAPDMETVRKAIIDEGFNEFAAAAGAFLIGALGPSAAPAPKEAPKKKAKAPAGKT